MTGPLLGPSYSDDPIHGGSALARSVQHPRCLNPLPPRQYCHVVSRDAERPLPEPGIRAGWSMADYAGPGAPLSRILAQLRR